MPTEMRHIIFTAVEIVEAITMHSRALGHPLPTGRVVEAAAADGEIGTLITFRMVIEPSPLKSEQASPKEPLEWAGPELTAALVRYCRSRAIPLPMKGSKALQRFGSQISLVVTIVPKNSALPTCLSATQVGSSS